MTRATLVGVVLAMGAMLGGCGSAGTGESGAYLVTGLEDRTDLFVAPGYETRPMTLDQLGAEGAVGAIAVDVEIYADIAVAFARDESGAAEYTRANIVGLWRVLDSGIVIETIDDELENAPPGPTYVPGGSIGRINEGGFERPNVTDSPEFDLVDFSDLVDTSIFEDARLWHDLNEAHPGCA